MKRKALMMTTLGLGAAYLLRNPNSRKKIFDQFQAMTKRK